MEPAHLPNNTTFLLSKPWKFQFISCHRSKVIPFLPQDRHTDRCTFCISICTGKIFFLYGNLYLSLHYVPAFAFLTHSLCLWRITQLLYHIIINFVLSLYCSVEQIGFFLPRLAFFQTWNRWLPPLFDFVNGHHEL